MDNEPSRRTAWYSAWLLLNIHFHMLFLDGVYLPLPGGVCFRRVKPPRAAELVDALLASTDVQRLNLGPLKTSSVEWDQPHEGNLFETLWERRAIQRACEW